MQKFNELQSTNTKSSAKRIFFVVVAAFSSQNAHDLIMSFRVESGKIFSVCFNLPLKGLL